MLVDFELGDSAVVKDQVFGIADAFGQGLVGYVYGVFAGFGDIGNPFGEGFFFFLFGAGKAGSAVGKGILSIPVDGFPPGESGQGGIGPASSPTFLFEVDGTRPYGSTVVVDDDCVSRSRGV